MPRQNRRLMNQINVVPYIDVMLVLLIIFMVTAPMIQPGSVDLPSVGKSSQPPVAPLEITVKADGTLTLRDRASNSSEDELSKAELAQRVRALGYGEQFPKASNSNAGSRQLNRRVEIIVANDGQAIPGRAATGAP